MVLRPYVDVLSRPGALAFSAAGVVARLPISMLGLGVVFAVERATGSYAAAGGVAAAYGLVQAVAAPRVAQLVDRHGQARVMRPAIAVHVAGLLGLVATARPGVPVAAMVACAVVMGATIGSIGALVRARWTALLGPGRDQHTAYSLESVLDEVVFVVGPLVVTYLAVGVGPAWGLVAAAVAVSTGGAWLLAQRGTEPPARGAAAPVGSSVLRAPGTWVLLVAFVGVGAVFGGVEVVVVAFTEGLGQPSAAAWVLVAFAVGSMVAGLGYGAVHWSSPASRRFPLGVVLLAAGCCPLLLVTTTPALALVVFVAGFAISPMIISGNAVVGELVEPSRLTEGLTWIATALSAGAAAGAAASGAVVDVAGARAGFWVPVVAGAVGAAVAVSGARWLSRPGLAGATPPPPAAPAPHR